jgi:threonyl-tRNA synthetase
MAAVKPQDFTKADTMRHSAAHVMAAAVLELWPDARLGVGPVIENGFFYDIAMEHKLTPLDLAKIEKRMEKIMQRNEPFVREEMPIDKAIEFFRAKGQDFKVELLTDLKTRGTTAVVNEDEAGELDAAKPDVASIYRTGEFVDLCRGPHVESSRGIGAVKLKSVAGAYWRGNQENAQLQRVYGYCFPTKDELAAHLKMLEEAEKRDHRKLGQELDLFTFSNLVGPGLPMFTPRGTLLRRELEAFVQSLQMPLGYTPVWIPHITKTDLYATSGHLEKFEDDLFYVSSKKTDERFVMKPMNCPHHTQIYASQPRSYRDLPLRFSEVTSVYRDENTGQLQGLSRVRAITQDDAHVFCRPDQIEHEANGVLDVIETFYAAFGMPLRIRLSVRDPKNPSAYLGSDEVWEKAESALAGLLEKRGKQYVRGEGEAAFYGPKIDFIATDAIGREWQLATIQLDFNLPERFDLSFMGDDGVKHRPVMIHRAILGSVERFLSILIEHFAGAFPAWLSPTQVQVLPVGRDHMEIAQRLHAKLLAAGIRSHVDTSDDTVGKKIRNAAKLKVPYQIVVGDKEAELKEVNVRIRGKEEEVPMQLEEFITSIAASIKERKMEL